MTLIANNYFRKTNARSQCAFCNLCTCIFIYLKFSATKTRMPAIISFNEEKKEIIIIKTNKLPRGTLFTCALYFDKIHCRSLSNNAPVSIDTIYIFNFPSQGSKPSILSSIPVSAELIHTRITARTDHMPKRARSHVFVFRLKTQLFFSVFKKIRVHT